MRFAGHLYVLSNWSGDFDPSRAADALANLLRVAAAPRPIAVEPQPESIS